MARLPARNRRPEEEELARKRSELLQLEDTLAERELELSTLQGELTAFERNYLASVGRRYAELDEIYAQITEISARLHSPNQSARVEAENARARAKESARIVDDSDRPAQKSEFKPSDNLRKLYREAAKLFHPDLTTDEAERARRHKVMSEVNQAYARGDENRIRAILREWESSPESIKGEGTGAELVRTIRKIAQVQARLCTIESTVDELRESELFRLRQKVQEAARQGKNLLAEQTRQLDEQIAQARARLAHMEERNPYE